ncbi:aminopeptidase O isoform X8 [Saimiri boliviensis]|uniref:aminopeptidase O isoform X8 n=1 Tax=Saimiri boliviensis TaxID=27679 RepID=UPI00193DE051|nr:aminopeptidase O isoform X5 [Saimiri boliviensis boliviensis]XP_039330595.1 aminopeptidase O isoform X5 [Saimiri boliviensis boliviensis]
MDIQLDPARDDLPLMANTSHILVKHYVLDLDVDFESQVMEGTIVLFLEDGNRFKKQNSSIEEACQSESNKACKFGMPEPCHVSVTNARTFSSEMEYNDFAICSKGEKDTSDKDGNHDNQEHASGISSSKYCCDTGNHGNEDFLLVLDCCDLSVLKVEEVDVAAVPGMEKFTRSPKLTVVSEELRNQIVRELVTLPADCWREQLDYYACCSQAPGCGELLFDTDRWSLQIRKTGAQTATDFPHAIRIWYKTKPEGRSVTWTSDQSDRPCVYTVGSPINNRALFPCQEPPVAMSTWQATVRAAASFVVLMSGENSAKPTQPWEGCSSWYYYVTMPMPASTFTIAVGCWTEMKLETCSSNDLATERPLSPSEADFRHVGVCSHMEYPCRFQNASAATQEIIPFRVFAPVCLKGACQETLLRLIPPCLSAAHSVLGTHPFSRLDVLIVPASFPSLGMARPSKDKTGHTSDSGASVIKHGLNPEKIFLQVHYLKGYFLLRFLAKRLGDETYFSFLRKFVHTFHGQLILSQDFLQMLLENIPEEKRLELSVENIYQDWLESSGIPKPLQRERRAGAECGLARQVRAEVTKWIQVNRRPRKRKRRAKAEAFAKLLPDQLVLLLEHLLEQKTLSPRTLQSLQRTYHLHDQDAEVRHRWCELIVKHKFTKAYNSVQSFLREDQAMGVYLYGELMVSEDARQQQLARRCFERTKEHMDRSSAQVVAEMLF